MDKLGLVAGGGALPVSLARHCRSTGRPLFVVRLLGFADPELAEFEGSQAGVGELGAIMRALKRAGCRSVCFAGRVDRPDFGSLRMDLRGMAALPKLLSAGRRGDDALLRALLREFETDGFAVEGADQVMGELILSAGPLGRHAPRPQDEADIRRALEVARAIGALDIGQGAVVCGGLVLAVEAQEGTDAMLERVATLPPALRGAPADPRGVLAKAAKPIQETRVDLPTFGPRTLEGCARAGLAGLAGEAGKALVLEREAFVALADELGLFVVGVEA